MVKTTRLNSVEGKLLKIHLTVKWEAEEENIRDSSDLQPGYELKIQCKNGDKTNQ